MMTNLLKETLDELDYKGKTGNDIQYVKYSKYEDYGIEEYYCSWEDFKEVAAKVDYYDGYGAVEILEIYIVGKDFWLERSEYEGSEWWEYKEMPHIDGIKYRKITKNEVYRYA